MPLCASALLMSALALGLILADIYHDRISYIAEHAILGGIVSVLFFTMCNYGYEMVNWAVFLILPLYIFMIWLLSSSPKEEECDECNKPKETCGCPEPEPKPTYKLSCPAKPIRLGTECGISRFT